MKSQTNYCLLAGNYICPIAFPQEYDYLLDEANRSYTNEWLGGLDMRLARVGVDGAFFMAPVVLQPQHVTKIRDDILRYRDTYGPYLQMLQLIREGSPDFTFTPGEFVSLATLMQSVSESATLDSRLRSMALFIRDAQQRFNQRELIKKLLDHLKADGYLILANATSEIYQLTGKVDQIKSVLHYLAENSEIVSTVEDDPKDAASDLFDEAVANGNSGT